MLDKTRCVLCASVWNCQLRFLKKILCMLGTWATLCSDNGFSSACKEKFHYWGYHRQKTCKVYDKYTHQHLPITRLHFKLHFRFYHIAVKPDHSRSRHWHSVTTLNTCVKCETISIPHRTVLWVETKWWYRLNIGRAGNDERWKGKGLRSITAWFLLGVKNMLKL